jgi:hypothetical protein
MSWVIVPVIVVSSPKVLVAVTAPVVAFLVTV